MRPSVTDRPVPDDRRLGNHQRLDHDHLSEVSQTARQAAERAWPHAEGMSHPLAAARASVEGRGRALQDRIRDCSEALHALIGAVEAHGAIPVGSSTQACELFLSQGSDAFEARLKILSDDMARLRRQYNEVQQEGAATLVEMGARPSFDPSIRLDLVDSLQALEAVYASLEVKVSSSTTHAAACIEALRFGKVVQQCHEQSRAELVSLRGDIPAAAWRPTQSTTAACDIATDYRQAIESWTSRLAMLQSDFEACRAARDLPEQLALTIETKYGDLKGDVQRLRALARIHDGLHVQKIKLDSLDAQHRQISINLTTLRDCVSSPGLQTMADVAQARRAFRSLTRRVRSFEDDVHSDTIFIASTETDKLLADLDIPFNLLSHENAIRDHFNSACAGLAGQVDLLGDLLSSRESDRRSDLGPLQDLALNDHFSGVSPLQSMQQAPSCAAQSQRSVEEAELEARKHLDEVHSALDKTCSMSLPDRIATRPLSCPPLQVPTRPNSHSDWPRRESLGYLADRTDRPRDGAKLTLSLEASHTESVNENLARTNRVASRQNATSVDRISAYSPDPENHLDVEVGRIVNGLPVALSIRAAKSERAGTSSGSYWIGDSEPKLYFCRILRSQTVMVRVGGGWSELDSFLRKHFAHLLSLPASTSLDCLAPYEYASHVNASSGKAEVRKQA